MAIYILSDVHMRLDRPERGQRLARMVARLEPSDRLIIAGDLVDFWYASRQRSLSRPSTEGLEALSAFRQRGGSITLLPGNHDGRLENVYRRRLGIGFQGPLLDLVEDGLRVRVMHGHRVGVRSLLKAGMESGAFLHAFGATPRPIASRLDRMLNASNDRERDVVDQKHLGRFRTYADQNRELADLFVFGHVHRVVDQAGPPRMIVLGGWHEQSSFLRIDNQGPRLLVEQDG